MDDPPMPGTVDCATLANICEEENMKNTILLTVIFFFRESPFMAILYG